MKTVDIGTMDFSHLKRAQALIEEELPKELAPIIRMDIDPYVPDRTNSLAASAFANEAALQEGKIVWGNTANNVTGEPVNNYAHAQYDGLPNKSTARHPKATTMWDLKAYSDNKERWSGNARKLAAQLAERARR